MKKKVMMFLLIALLGIGNLAQAQNRSKMSERLKAYSEKMTKDLAKEMDLDEETEKWFVDLYQEYQDTLRATRFPQRIDDKLLQKMSDEEANQMIEDMFTLSEYRVALQRAYYLRFKEKLNAKQMVKVFIPNPKNFMRSHPNMNQMMRNYPSGSMGKFGGTGGFSDDF